ncbi:hypothetical protein F5Y13DRAFT_160054 [Hypoxylon sp. FL1857]|nr:hypothetical protein F5Y13DRAFT_160054 [Hypoxylon sp. FL1857]
MMSKPDSRPMLAKLPYELIVQIISDGQFWRSDWKDFRLVCRAFEQPAASLLFRAVVVSRLRKDRDAFEQIAAHSHLAQHVRQIIWHELRLEAWLFPDEDDSKSQSGNRYYRSLLGPEEVEGITLGDITRIMLAAANDPELFWWPRISEDPIADQNRQRIISDFLSRFTRAVDSMPKLTSFRLCPMPADREFLYKGYPIRADLYRYWTNHSVTRISEGFCSFMLPVMGRAGSKIVSLHWADETIHTSLALDMECKDKEAFSALTSIDLCIGGIPDREKVTVPNLVSCLKAATNLQHLSLCVERADGISQQKLVDGVLGCRWPHLLSLRLSNHCGSVSNLDLFCKAHCETLRHLAFDICQVLNSDILRVKNSSKLRLDSITISTPSATLREVSEGNLLACLNGESSQCLTVDGSDIFGCLEDKTLKSNYSKSAIHTEVSKYDYHAWCMAGRSDLDVAHCKYTCDEAYALESCSEDEDADYEETKYEDVEDEREGEFRDTEPKTYWAWCRCDSDEIYYWKVDEENADEAQAETTHWHFTSRDGTTAFGKDPLDYFSDWESDEGDVATPTPFGKALLEFSRGDEVSGQPPPGAIRYDKLNDPYFNPQS